MKAIKYIAVLIFSLYVFCFKQNIAIGHTFECASFSTLPDTIIPTKLVPILVGDTAEPYEDVEIIVTDSSYDETNRPAKNLTAVSLSNIEDTPAGSIYGEWDTLSVHSTKFDALTFDDTIRIPLNDPGHCNYVHPFNGSITSAFGYRGKRYHFAVDINLETGDTVRCAFDGKVRIAQISKSYGFVVVVRHNNGLETYYAHLSKLLVKPGDEMEAGMILGLGGNTGHSFGSHLHFETRFRGIAIDPSNLINFQTQTLHTDTYNLTKSDFKYLAEQYKIRHYSRKRKKTWYTYYCPGGASYSTPAAKAIMAKVPKPTLPTKNATAVNVANNGNHSAPTKPITKEATSTTPKKPVVQPKKTTSTAKTPKKAETQTGKPIYYTIKSGDSLYSIAIKYKTTVPKICALNGIKAKDILSIGKKLRVN